jgi:hypothetical protein
MSAMVACVECGLEKSPDEFYCTRGRNGVSNKPMKRCKKCYTKYTTANNKERYRTSYKCRVATRAAARQSHLRLKYGMTEDDYHALLARQGGRCAICSATKESRQSSRRRVYARNDPKQDYRLCIDHCHQSGKVRGVLCSRCNSLIGQAKDDPAVLLAAAQYLLRHQGMGDAQC